MQEDLTLKIDLNAPVTLADCASVPRSFFTWWIQELKGLLPTGLQATLQNMARTPRVVFENGGWRLENAGEQPLIFSSSMAAYEIQEEVFRNAPLALTRSVDVVLLRSDALFKRVRLPASATTRLRQIIRLQLDRLSPFRGDDVHFDCYTVEQPQPPLSSELAGSDDITVEVAIVSKPQLLAAEQKLREIGLVPRAFCFAGGPARLAALGFPWTKSAQHRMAAASAGLLLFLAAILLGPTMRDREIGELKVEIEALAPQVQHALAERDELFRYQLPPQALSSNRVPVLDLILDLTKRIPDNAHISRLDVIGTQVEFQGSAPTSLDIKSLLTRSLLLEHLQVDRDRSNGSFSANAALRPQTEAERN